MRHHLRFNAPSVEHSCKDNCAQAHCPSRGSASSETFFSIAPSSNRSYRICEAPLGATTNPRRFRLAPLMRQDVGEICSQFRSKRHLPFTSLLLKVVGWLVLDPYGRTKPLLPIGLFAKKTCDSCMDIVSAGSLDCCPSVSK